MAKILQVEILRRQQQLQQEPQHKWAAKAKAKAINSTTRNEIATAQPAKCPGNDGDFVFREPSPGIHKQIHIQQRDT